jgi:hypothetical protein
VNKKAQMHQSLYTAIQQNIEYFILKWSGFFNSVHIAVKSRIK